MEIEAKFIVPDRATFERLLQIERLAGFVLSPALLKRMHDQYLDTADGAFLRGGFACRMRVDGGGGCLVTLKALTPSQGLLHVRQELEVRLPQQDGLNVARWPDCDATALARQLSSGQPLELLFDLQQERYQRLAFAGEKQPPFAELSIDRVRFSAAIHSDLLGVEAELLPAGEILGLQALADELQQVWGLTPEPVSKFERGLALARPELAPLIYAR
ncbi:MAG TPA: CYTH domain-containing protein [Anaerolineae bacterium]|nr:CYTH domain-containing protein [Anaerolineae bacterium]